MTDRERADRGERALRRLGADPDVEELGVRMRAELRAEAAEYEALAALDLARSQRLLDVLAAAMRRGDEVELLAGDGRFRGLVKDAVGDLVRLRGEGEVIDVAVDAIRLLRLTGSARVPVADRPRRTATTFRARLAEHEGAAGALVIETDGPVGTLRGTIEVVASDHLVIRIVGAGRVHLALSDVVAVRRSSGGSR